MTPQEKAQELFDKMNGAQDEFGSYPMCFDTAKQCALTAVDELISYSKEWDDSDYWTEVKQEIEKL